MKKTLLTLALAVCATLGFAQNVKTYTDNIVVTVNGESTAPMPATILMEDMQDGTCTLSLKNFALAAGEDFMYVGNIELPGITLQDEGAYQSFATQQTITIQPGDDKSKTWLGPILGLVPIDMQGKIAGDKLYCTIDIDMQETIGQIIGVVFGQDPTGIHAATVGNPAARVNVYNVNGQCIRRGVLAADALSGLSRGIYIVNGKKIIK